MFYVYRLIVAGKPYLGFTSKSPVKRAKEHVKTARSGWSHNSKLYPMLKSNNFEYKLEIVGEHIEEIPALMQEIREIYNVGLENSLNVSRGGEGRTVTIITRERNGKLEFKIAPRGVGPDNAGKKYKLKKNKPHGNKGKKATSRARRNMSRARKGRFTGKDNSFYGKTHTEETKAKCAKSTAVPIFAEGKEWPSLTELARSLGVTTTCIFGRLQRNYKDYRRVEL